MYYDQQFFSPHGPLAQLEGYEYRAQQQKMADLVYEVLENGHIGIIEAGTGTGKSLAYLYPAICFACKQGEKVVVSTNTITLQEQLLKKDLPILRQLGLNFKAVVVKGWNNYPCWLRIEELGAYSGSPDKTGIPAELQLLAEAKDQEQTEVLSLFDSLPGEIKEQIQAESDLCLRGKCAFFNQCLVFAARRLAENADLVIANHHLLLADVSIRREVGWEGNAVLPRYQHVILDEAHHLESTATEYFGVQVSLLRLQRLVSALDNSHGKTRGLLQSLRSNLVRSGISEADDERITIIDWQLLPQLRIIATAAHQFFQVLEQYAAQMIPHEESMRIPYGGFTAPEILEGYDRFYSALAALQKQMEQLTALMAGDESDRVNPYIKRLRALIADLEFVMEAKDRNHVYWLKRLAKHGCALYAAPISVGEQLKDNLLFQVKSAIFTSATLSVNADFSYFCQSIGIDHAEQWDLLTEVFPSPFDYRQQVYLAVARDLPSPDNDAFIEQFVEHLDPLLALTEGRAFILFTSYQMMQQVVRLVREKGLEQKYRFLVQGELPRGEMLERFKIEKHTVLLGTDSFWEGVDVAGDALSIVIITKLPFKVPTDPIVAARSEKLQADGLNPFVHYHLPQAVLKFRQGCGRLIRTKTDRGIVLICDRRIMERSYGRFFLQALPACSVHYKSLAQIKQEVASWL